MLRADEVRGKVAATARVALATLPTPLHRAERFSDAVGAEVLIKRDDLTGFAVGGNKARKIEFLLADAAARGADTLITVGGGQSNHARMVAAAASIAGMSCHLVLGGDRPRDPTGNVLLDRLFGAHVHFGGTEDWDVLEKQMGELATELTSGGAKTYAMPIGGSTPIGALGFVAAWFELSDQCAAAGVEPRWIVHATSSGGTQAGLEGTRRMLGIEEPRVLGVSVAKTAGELSDEVGELVAGVMELLGADPDDAPGEILEGYMGSAYGEPTEGGRAALELLARTEGIPTDPVYSAKALHGLIDHALDLGGPIVFWHTGGLPALFSDEQELMRWDSFSPPESRGG